MPPQTATTKASAAIQPDVLSAKIADPRRSRPARFLSDIPLHPGVNASRRSLRDTWWVNRFGVLEVGPTRSVGVPTMVDLSTW
jgi:hypothetical protein